jgi:hypothetical protein
MKIFILLSILQITVLTQDNSIISRWNNNDTLIRDLKIDKDDAIDSLDIIIPIAIEYCKDKNILFTHRNDWVFPMSDFTQTSYREGGNDFRTDYFDYFEGAEFYGHPAHDIFILDKDSNGIEDSTGRRVNAVAMVSGVVITSYGKWKIGDIGRAGNYINLFDPAGPGIFYYSHLDSVFVKSGDIVKAGDVIGLVGRTGRKAVFGKTHIHIGYYKITNGYPEPVDIIKKLYAAEKQYREQKK